jgi:PAS domain S-box-containing protein
MVYVSIEQGVLHMRSSFSSASPPFGSPLEMIESIGGQIVSAFGANRVVFAEIDRAASWVHLIEEWRDDNLPEISSVEPKLIDKLLTIAAGQLSLKIADVNSNKSLRPFRKRLAELQIGSVLNIRAGSYLITFCKAGPYEWRNDAIELLQDLGIQVSARLERDRAEVEIRKSEKQVRVVTDAMPALISYIDPNYTYRFANRTYYDWFGYLPDALIGKSMAEVLGKGAFEKLRPHVDKALRGEADIFETEVPYRKAGTRSVRATYTPDVDVDGDVKGIFVLVLDITEIKKAEETQARLAAIVEYSDDAIISKNLDGIIQTWNHGAERLFGYQAEEMIGQPVTKIIPPDRLQEEPEILNHIMMGRSLAHYETVRRRKNGDNVEISLTVSPIKNRVGKVVGASKIARDITDRKSAEKKIRESEERFSKAFNSAPLTVTITSLETGVLLEVNDTFVEITGIARDKAIGRRTSDLGLWPADVRDAELNQLVNEGHIRGQEYEFVMPDGTRIVGLLSAELIELNGKKCALTVIQDITEIRRAENSVRERELLKALVRAQEDERKRIARDLHDELGQQLTVLRLKVDAARKSVVCDQDLAGRFREIDEIAERIDHGVNFLAWELRPAALDQLGLIPAIKSYVSRWSQQSGIAVELFALKPKRNLLSFEVETNLYRIVQEALTNVQRYSKASRVEITLRERKDGYVLIIDDNGIGFDSESNAKTPKGLGLLGMKERAALMGGYLDIDSEPEKGTTLLIRIPISALKKESSRPVLRIT